MMLFLANSSFILTHIRHVLDFLLKVQIIMCSVLDEILSLLIPLLADFFVENKLLNSDTSTAARLARLIFEIKDQECIPKRLRPVVPILQKLLKKFHSKSTINFTAVLNKYCPIQCQTPQKIVVRMSLWWQHL